MYMYEVGTVLLSQAGKKTPVPVYLAATYHREIGIKPEKEYLSFNKSRENTLFYNHQCSTYIST